MKSIILLIEDEPGIRLAVKDELKFEGFQIRLAEDGPPGCNRSSRIRRTLSSWT